MACRSKQSLDTPPAPSYLPYITAAIGDWLLPRCPPGYTSSSTIGTMDPLSLNVKEEFEGDDNASDDTLVDICASQEVGPCSSIASRSIPQVLLYATTCDDIYENPDREGAPAKASHSGRVCACVTAGVGGETVPGASMSDIQAIHIKMLSGRSLTVDVDLYHPILCLQLGIQDKEGIPLDEQRLILAGGKQLLIDETFHDHIITAGSTVYLIICLRAGGHRLEDSMPVIAIATAVSAFPSVSQSHLKRRLGNVIIGRDDKWGLTVRPHDKVYIGAVLRDLENNVTHYEGTNARSPGQRGIAPEKVFTDLLPDDSTPDDLANLSRQSLNEDGFHIGFELASAIINVYLRWKGESRTLEVKVEYTSISTDHIALADLRIGFIRRHVTKVSASKDPDTLPGTRSRHTRVDESTSDARLEINGGMEGMLSGGASVGRTNRHFNKVEFSVNTAAQDTSTRVGENAVACIMRADPTPTQVTITNHTYTFYVELSHAPFEMKCSVNLVPPNVSNWPRPWFDWKYAAHKRCFIPQSPLELASVAPGEQDKPGATSRTPMHGLRSIFRKRSGEC